MKRQAVIVSLAERSLHLWKSPGHYFSKFRDNWGLLGVIWQPFSTENDIIVALTSSGRQNSSFLYLYLGYRPLRCWEIHEDSRQGTAGWRYHYPTCGSWGLSLQLVRDAARRVLVLEIQGESSDESQAHSDQAETSRGARNVFFFRWENLWPEPEEERKNNRWLSKSRKDVSTVMHTKFAGSAMVVKVVNSECDVMSPYFFLQGAIGNTVAYTEELSMILKLWITAVARGRPYVFFSKIPHHPT